MCFNILVVDSSSRRRSGTGDVPLSAWSHRSIEQATKNVQHQTSSLTNLVLRLVNLQGANGGPSAKWLNTYQPLKIGDELSNAASTTTREPCTALQFFIVTTKTNATEKIAQSKGGTDPTP